MNTGLHHSIRLSFLAVTLTTLLVLCPLAALAADTEEAAPNASLPPVAEKQGVTYATDIKPLLDRSCIKCHGEEKQKAKLRLDSHEAVLAGTPDEPILVVGKSAESHIVLAVSKATKEEDEWMPPEGKAQELSSEEIGLLRAWIDQGAK